MISKLLLSIFTLFFINTVFRSEQHCLPSRKDSLQCPFCVSNLIQTFQTDWVKYSTQSILFIHNSCSVDFNLFCHTSCTSVLPQLSSLTIIHFIMGVKSCFPTFLVEMSSNCIPPSHQSILCIRQFSPFLTKCTLLAIFLLCLVPFPLLAIHTADLLSNIIRGFYSGTISGPLFKN